MIVGVCYTKKSAHGNLVCDAFRAGVQEAGDTAIKITIDDRKLFKQCDVLVTCCIYNRLGTPSGYADFRKDIEDQPQPKICMDMGFWKNPREANHKVAYMSVGIGGIKSAADYANANSPSDRFDALGIPMLPWRTQGEHVLVLGQVLNGSSTQHLGGGGDWMEMIYSTIRKYTRRRVVVRLHPNDDDPRVPQAFEVTSPGESLLASLKNAWCAVSLTSNAVVAAVTQGIPVIAMDPISVAYPISSHSLTDIEKPRMVGLTTGAGVAYPGRESCISREQWAYDLAYAQWNPSEIRKGLPWKRLKNRLIELR